MRDNSSTKGKAVKYYRLAKDPNGCHSTYVDHVVSYLIKTIGYAESGARNESFFGG